MALVPLIQGLDWRVTFVDATGAAFGTVGNPINVSGSAGGMTVSGTKSNNAVVPGSTNLGVLPAIANSASPTWTEGNQVLLSTDLLGNLRVNLGSGVFDSGNSAIRTEIINNPIISGTVSVSNFPATQNVTAVGLSYNHISTATTTTVKSGAGTLHNIVINTKGIAGIATVYDNTTATAPVIAVIDVTIQPIDLNYDIKFNTGLTIVTTGSTAPDITVSYA
jgi:hypothetical protein